MKGWLVYSGRSDAVWKIVICLIPTKNKNLDEFIGEVMPGQQHLFFIDRRTESKALQRNKLNTAFEPRLISAHFYVH